MGAQAERITDVAAADGADGLVLPGVGAFPEAMRRLRSAGFDGLARDWAAAGRPLLGHLPRACSSCSSSSTENEGAEGLGLLDGEVTALDAPGLKVPHMGWEPVRWERESRLAPAGAGAETPFYFVHSFAARPSDPDVVVGTAEWGERFAAVVEHDSVSAPSFTRRSRARLGSRLLAAFAAACEPVAA